MLVDAQDLVDGLEIKLTFSQEEVNHLKDGLRGRQGIIDWYRLGPSQQKIIHCAKEMCVRETKNPLFMLSMKDLSEEKIKECLADPLVMAKHISSLPDYKCFETRLISELENEIASTQAKCEREPDESLKSGYLEDIRCLNIDLKELLAYNAKG